jgi:hypothetical protein
MSTRRGLPALALALVGIALAIGTGIGPDLPAPATVHASHAEPDSWSFEIGRPLDVPRAGRAEKMFGFLFEVSAEGSPELGEVYLLRGRAPAHRPSRDLARTYRWSLRDARGQTLREGLFTDRIAVYTPTPDAPCQKDVAGNHAMMIRTPWHADAQTIHLELESIQGETIEEHDHR